MMGVTFVHAERQILVAGQAVTDQDSVEMGPQGVKDHVFTAALLDPIDRSVWGGEGPQPTALAAHPPTGFVDVHGRLVAQPHQQVQEGALGFVGNAMQGLGQSAGCDGQSAQLLQHPTGLSHGQAELFVQKRGQGQGTRPQMRACRSDGRTDLRRMLASNRPAVRTCACVGDQLGDVGTDRRQILDELFTRMNLADVPATTGAVGQRNLDPFIDVVRPEAMRRWVAFLASRLASLGRRLSILLFAAEGRRLACGFAFQLLDSILQLLNQIAKRPVLLRQSLDFRAKFSNALITRIDIHAIFLSPPFRVALWKYAP